MLLVVDVGNTNITFGVFDGEQLEATFRMTTKLQRTSDEYGICVRDPGFSTVIRESEIGDSPEACGPISLVSIEANKRTLSNKVEGENV